MINNFFSNEKALENPKTQCQVDRYIISIVMKAVRQRIGMGFQKNGYHLLSTSKKAKVDLAQYIAEKAGLENLSDNTRFGTYRFTIWNFKLKK